MDFNFADLKKEAANTTEDIFNRSSDAAKQTATNISHDLFGVNAAGSGSHNVSSPGRQDDNAHTEQYFANEQKDLNFEHVDPQTFVQRMSAGAKEAQEKLDEKFAKHTNDYDDFLTNASKDLTNFGQQFKQDMNKGMASMTHDFMNAERNLYGAGGDNNKKIEQNKTNVIEEDLLGVGDAKYAPTAPMVPLVPVSAPVPAPAPAPVAVSSQNKFVDDDFMGTAAFSKSNTSSTKDSDTDSPSVSYNPSPVKKPITDKLKEQDNEKFISSEDLLGDYKDERTGTPEFHAAAIAKPKATNIPTTDLDADDDNDDDDDDDFMHEMIDKHSGVQTVKDLPKTSATVPTPTPTPIPAVVPVAVSTKAPTTASFVTEPVVKPADKPTPLAPLAPVAPVAAPVAPVAVTAPAVKTITKSTADKSQIQQQQQPNIIYVEELFYKYGLDAWFKPERLHPKVESLIYWRDVKKSGIVFGAGLVSLLAVSCFSVISVFAYLGLILLCGTIAFRIYKSVLQAIQKTPDGHPFKEYLDIDLTLSPEKTQNIAGVAVAHINGFIAELRRLFLVEDLVDSIKFGVILWVLTYIGSWFNGMTLVILAFVSLFTLPKVYENNKQSIDTYLDLVRSKIAEITEKIKAAVPIGNKKPIAAETDKDK